MHNPVCPLNRFILDTPIVKTQVNGLQFHVKRDDLIHPELNGNKARKLQHYLNLNSPDITKVISCGGNQSNAMFAISVLARIKHWHFEYYLKKLPDQLSRHPVGNFKLACDNGMEYREVESFPELRSTQDTIAIEHGCSEPGAEIGIAILANEINQWVRAKSLTKCSIFLPSGTGTTAYYLQQHSQWPVYTTPCIGNADFLRKQWSLINSDTRTHPIIISAKKPVRFGQLDINHLNLWKSLQQSTHIEFDLLYDPQGWSALLENRSKLPGEVIYIHCGGLSGNTSMLDRYNHFLSKQHSGMKRIDNAM